MKLVINTCYGGFGLSTAAYEKLIEYGVPVRAYIDQKYDEDSKRYLPEPLNDGEVIFDRSLSKGSSSINDMMLKHGDRYWDCWTQKNRAHPLVVRVVKELGKAANGRCADLKIVNIPKGVDYVIEEYDGLESIHETHRVWS